MKRGLDQIEELKDDGMRYVKLRWASLRLEAADKLSSSLSRAFGYALFISLLLIALAFLMVALALWIGEMLGALSLGFLIAGGGFLAGALLIYFWGGRFVVNTLVRHFIDLFFTDNNPGHGTQE